VEIGNVGSGSALLGGLRLIVGSSSTQKAYSFPADASWAVLAPGHYQSFRASTTKLILRNTGDTVSLLSGTTVVDSLSYGQLPQGMSLGRDPKNADHIRRFCTPTESAPNADGPLGTRIEVQSGEVRGEKKVTLNLQAAAIASAFLGEAGCAWDYGDGYRSESCNPPSHTITLPGSHAITLEVTYACDITERATLPVEVLIAAERRATVPSSDPGGGGGARAGEASAKPPERTRRFLHGQVVVSAAMPNPSGKDDGIEWMELMNISETDADLDGWMIDNREGAGAPFILSAVTLQPRESRRFVSALTGIGLRNTSDQARLLDPDGFVASLIEWTDAVENKIYRAAFRPSGRITVHVVRVVDGDTLDIALKDTTDPDLPPSLLHRWRALERVSGATIRVRLIGVDAPETKHPRKNIERYGAEASEFVRSLTEGKDVELEFEPEIWDTYERLLAYVVLPGGQLLQAKLLQAGLASAYVRYPFSLKELFLAYEAEAKKSGAGMWSDEEVVRVLQTEQAQQVSKGSGALTRLFFDEAVESVYFGSGILISEVYPSPSKGEEEWIELINVTEERISLAGWSLDDAQKGSKPWVMDASVVIVPNGFFVITKGRSGIALNNDGDDVRLIAPDGSIADQVTYGRMKKGWSFVRLMRRGDVHPRGECLSERPTPGTLNRCVQTSSSRSKATSSLRSTARVVRAVPSVVASNVRWVAKQVSTVPSTQNAHQTGSLLALLSKQEVRGSVLPIPEHAGSGVFRDVMLFLVGCGLGVVVTLRWGMYRMEKL
jgi:endonuclease YncB( thermonuclease family)